MKRKKTAADYGIKYTGAHLKQFNRTFLNRFNGQRGSCSGLMALFVVVFAGFSAIVAWEKCTGAAARAVMSAVPALMFAAILILFFVRKDAALEQIYNAMMLAFLPMFVITAVCATEGELINYALYWLSFAAAVFVGLKFWSRLIVRWIWKKDPPEATGTGGSTSAAGAVAVMVCAVVRPFAKAVQSAEIRIILGVAAALAITMLIGFFAGVALGNARYYRFLRNG